MNITLSKPSKEFIVKLYCLIDKDRDYYSILPWSHSCTESSLLEYFKSKETTADEIVIVCVDNEPIGVIDGRKSESGFDIGYWIGKDYAKKGYMSTAVKLFLNSCIDTTTAKALITNLSSRKVLEKCNFALVLTDKQYCYYEFIHSNTARS